jgi:hypothetical protein
MCRNQKCMVKLVDENWSLYHTLHPPLYMHIRQLCMLLYRTSVRFPHIKQRNNRTLIRKRSIHSLIISYIQNYYILSILSVTSEKSSTFMYSVYYSFIILKTQALYTYIHLLLNYLYCM